jgi:hypothetical protein
MHRSLRTDKTDCNEIWWSDWLEQRPPCNEVFRDGKEAHDHFIEVLRRHRHFENATLGTRKVAQGEAGRRQPCRLVYRAARDGVAMLHEARD